VADKPILSLTELTMLNCCGGTRLTVAISLRAPDVLAACGMTVLISITSNITARGLPLLADARTHRHRPRCAEYF